MVAQARQLAALTKGQVHVRQQIVRSFRLGDQIVVGDTVGNVERIELRATQIRTYDGRAVIVPNAELLTSRIVNNTAAPVRRGSVELGLGYKADLHRSRDVLGAMRSGFRRAQGPAAIGANT